MFEKIVGIISCDKLVSVDRRISGRRGRGRSKKLALSPEYTRELEQLDHSLSLTGIPRNSFDKDAFYSLNLTFLLKDNFKRRDSDNLLKAVIDAITRYLGFDDNKIVSHNACKRSLSFPKGMEKKEFVIFEIQKLNKKLEDFIVPFEKLFLKEKDVVNE